MAGIREHRRTLGLGLGLSLGFGLAAWGGLVLAPALAQEKGSKAATDLFDRPVLALDPGMHTAAINSQSVDAKGRFAVTGGDDRTVRIWSLADGKLLRTIWIPVGPGDVGSIYAVAMSPDGSIVAAGGYAEQLSGDMPIYIFDRDSGQLIRRIHGDLPNVTKLLAFSPDGRYLAATLGGENGLRVFDRDKDWGLTFRDNLYGDDSYGVAFSGDGRLATTSYDGKIRHYDYVANADRPNFHIVGDPIPAPSGGRPRGVAYSPDSKWLAVGYRDAPAVDIFNSATLERVGGQHPTDATPNLSGLEKVAWSRDGQTLFAVGAVKDAKNRYLLFDWDRRGLGDEHRMTYCAGDSAAGVNALPDGRILVSSLLACIGVIAENGEQTWVAPSPILDFRNQTNTLRVSRDARIVDFGYLGSAGPVLRFDASSLTLSNAPRNDGLTMAPNQEGLPIDGWKNTLRPTLDGKPLPFFKYEVAESLAVAADRKRFYLGSGWAIAAFDDAGVRKWRQSSGGVWAVNASGDGRIVVTADFGGAIRWRRADDGRELLSLQVIPNGGAPAQWDWVLWTPEGFYDATPGAENALKWVVNHGPDEPAKTFPVAAFPNLHQPGALKYVLTQLETERALGIAVVAAARLDVQQKTGSAKPPGGALHVLTIGVDKFGLKFAAADARDVAETLLETQRLAPGKASLYSDVTIDYLQDQDASHKAILAALDRLIDAMGHGGPQPDLAVLLFSGHGEMIDGQFYLVPYDVELTTPSAIEASAISADELANKVRKLAAKGKVLLLLDACHSGAVGPGVLAANASVLRDKVYMDNVTVLTSSQIDELSQELPAWRHGAFTQAILNALAGGADPQGHGVISMSELVAALDHDLSHLTDGKPHLGHRVNFGGDLFVVRH